MFIRAIFICALLGVMAVAQWAQSPSGRISGRVLDPMGASVGAAEVSARDIETGRMHRTRAGPTGEFRFIVLPVGFYELIARATDLEGQPIQLRLEVGSQIRVDLTTAIAGERASVEVTTQTPLLEPENSALGSVIRREDIADLPLNEREFLQLALLSPGVAPGAEGSELARQNRSGLNINGGREAANNFLLDGVDNNDLYINRLVVSPPLDFVREFRLHSANYQAEFGRSGGAQINVVSQGGSNSFHGSAYEYLRNDAIDARNFFDPPGDPPQYQRNQFGVSIGGPIRRERTFFFAGYEGTRIRDAVTQTARIPTVAERMGDFSESGQPVIDPFTQQPFAGNRIPAGRIDPIGASLAAYWPEPNRPDPAQNFVSSPVGNGHFDQGYGRIDHYLTPADALYFRYNLSDDKSLDPFGDNSTQIPGYGNFVINRGQNLVAGETHVFSPNTVSEFRFGFNRLRREVLQQNIGNDVAAQLGIAGVASEPDFTGFPALNVAGYDTPGDGTAQPIIRRDNTFHGVQNVTHVRGAHTFKTGVEYRRVSVDGIQALFARGQFNFLGAFTTNPVGDLLLGFPTFTIQTKIDNPLAQRASAWNGYLQDDWRISPKLTLNLGVRYEWNQPAVDADDHFTVFDLDRAELVPAGSGGVPRAGFEGDANNFAPRIGLSWSPRPANDLILRGGYGVFYDVTILEANSGLYFNPPFFELSLFFPTGQRLLTLADPFPAGAGFQPAPSVNTMQADFRTAYQQHWNASVEKALPGRWVARGMYVGSKGTKLLRRRDLNQPSAGPGEVDARRPVKGVANAVLFESAASSIYHSAQLSLERRFATGFSFSAAYTFSKSIDDVSAFLDSAGDGSFPQNSHDLAAERGLSNFDQRQRFVFTTSYDLPFRRNILARDWHIFAIGAFQSGTPFTPILSFDNSNTGNTGGIFGADRPDAVSDPGKGASTPEQFFNTAAFATAPEFSFGNAGRNVLTGPGMANVDVAVVRRFRLGDSAHVDFRAEAFNLANRANFNLPRRISDQPTFGRVTSAGPSRQIQFGLRLRF